MSADLDTAIVFTTRMRELAEFYAAGLELGDPQESPGHIGYQVGRVYLGFDQVESPFASPAAVTLWFRVDDLDATFSRFVEMGAEVVYPVKDTPWGDRLAAIRDLDGNRIGLSQARPASDV